jgi:hypothetical protein
MAIVPEAVNASAVEFHHKRYLFGITSALKKMISI